MTTIDQITFNIITFEWLAYISIGGEQTRVSIQANEAESLVNRLQQVHKDTHKMEVKDSTLYYIF